MKYLKMVKILLELVGDRGVFVGALLELVGVLEMKFRNLCVPVEKYFFLITQFCLNIGFVLHR